MILRARACVCVSVFVCVFVCGVSVHWCASVFGCAFARVCVNKHVDCILNKEEKHGRFLLQNN